MTSGSSAGVDLPVDGEVLLVSSWGGSRRPPVVPPTRLSPLLSEVDGLGLLVVSSLPSAEPPLALGAGRSGSVVPGEPVPVERCLPPPWVGGCGRSDECGATSSSMASKTDETC